MEKKSFQNQLNLAHNMIEEGNIAEALEFLNAFEAVDSYPERERMIFFMFTSKIHHFLENYAKAYERAETGIQSAKNVEGCLEKVDIHLLMADILKSLGKNKESIDCLEESTRILENLTEISEQDRNSRTGLIYVYKAFHFATYLGKMMQAFKLLTDAIPLLEKWGSQANISLVYSNYGIAHVHIGKDNTALHYLLKSQEICDKKKSPQFNNQKLLNLLAIGTIYEKKGELQLALDYYQQAVSLARKTNKSSFTKIGLVSLGAVYRELGELDLAVEVHKEALPIAENIGNVSSIVSVLGSFLSVYVAKGDISAAQQLFQKIEQCRDQEKENNWINLVYQLSKADLMRMSNRTRDLGVAQEILKKIATEEVIFMDLTQKAILSLCEMLLDEFNTTKNIEALNEFSSLLARLQEVAEKQQSYKLLAETYLLDAKLSLIHFDFKKTRHSLTQAQQIAERYELKLLAIKISNEHDRLLQNLDVWDQMKKENVNISKRLEKINLNDQILRMLKKKPSEIPETSQESPILLLIMADSGAPIYTKIFSKEWKIKEVLFSGFLTAFNSFSDEIFSKGLDRASFGKFTILMTNIPPIMSCYVFEGQSFLAQQKFSEFNEKIHDTEPMWDILSSAVLNGEIIQDDPTNELGKIVKAIF
jgi:tetratricopeptide (TPR) repeat protein